LLPILDSYLTVFTENNIPNQLMKQFFAQAFYFINFTLFNPLYTISTHTHTHHRTRTRTRRRLRAF
jgi:hypothetical protein